MQATSMHKSAVDQHPLRDLPSPPIEPRLKGAVLKSSDPTPIHRSERKVLNKESVSCRRPSGHTEDQPRQ